MIRRTVVLPEALAKQVEKLAKKDKKSFSSVLSALVDEALRKRKATYAWIGAGESGVPDLGRNAEDYLAGSIVRE